jgi:hypothetical protein
VRVSLQEEGLSAVFRNKEQAAQARATHWLGDLFRAIVCHPAAPILIADNDRNYRETGMGAGKLLGLPREKIINLKSPSSGRPFWTPVSMKARSA